MTLECTSCHARYSIADSLIPAEGARIKCRKCGEILTIEPPVIELAPTDLEVIPPPSPAPAPRRAPAADAAQPAPRQSAPPAPRQPAPPAQRQMAPLAPRQPDPSKSVRPEPPVTQPSSGFAPGSTSFELEAPPGIDTPVTDDVPEAPASDSGFERFGESARFAAPAPHVGAEATPFGSAPALDVAPVVDSAPSLGAPPALEAPPIAAPSPAPQPPPAVAAAAIPEGLGPDERARHEKARRLARVLASDIAIYNREKRDRGIKDGNLVAVLGYEIKKSWEIYKERVTPEFANSTPYFRDALNEMLAEGKKIF